jgi:hypothetical protein
VQNAPTRIFVVAISDCYTINPGAFTRGRTWTRNITYEAAVLNSAGQYVPLSGVTIAEQLSYISGPHPLPSSSPPGQNLFYDRLSVGNGANFTETQTFSVTYQGVTYNNVQIVSVSGTVSPSNLIVATPAYIDINKNPNLLSKGLHPLCGN